MSLRLTAPSSADSSPDLPLLNARGLHLLRVLVERYIQDGQPVGSRTLARAAGLDLSPATIRNVVADLEDMGLVISPHTSAGRVPTALGYRTFIERLLPHRPPPSQAVRVIRRGLDPDHNTRELVNSASLLLSSVTQLTALVTPPRQGSITLRQVAFLPLSEKRVLAVLVLNEREVQNRVLHTRQDYNAAELERVAAYINSEFQGCDLGAIRGSLLQEMDAARDDLNVMMQAAVEVGTQAFDNSSGSSDDFVVSGEENLLGCGELEDREQMHRLFEAFNHKRDILHLLDQCLEADGVRVLIGEESGYDPLDSCSLVTAPYEAADRVGVVGVIGPTRMCYGQVIPLVTATALLLGSALKEH